MYADRQRRHVCEWANLIADTDIVYGTLATRQKLQYVQKWE